MKTPLTLAVAILISVRLSAQVQELEQLRLDLEKLAQFKLMLSEMKSGYQTLDRGYNAVRDAGKANFNLHQNYLDGLLLVSPQVRNHPAVNRIFKGQTQLLADYKSLLSMLKTSNALTSAELNEVMASGDRILSVASADADLLSSVLTPGKLRMSDGERTELIATVDKSIQQQLKKLTELKQEYDKLVVLRLQQKRDMETLKRLGNH